MKKQDEKNSEPTKLIVYRELKKLVPLSRSALWRLEKEGKFPRRRLITDTKVAWVLGEVLAWIDERTPVGEDAKPAHNFPPQKPQNTQMRPPLQRPKWMEREDD